MMASAQGSCLAGLTHLGAAFLVLLGLALVLLAYKVVSTTSGLGEVYLSSIIFPRWSRKMLKRYRFNLFFLNREK